MKLLKFNNHRSFRYLFLEHRNMLGVHLIRLTYSYYRDETKIASSILYEWDWKESRWIII